MRAVRVSYPELVSGSRSDNSKVAVRANAGILS